MPSFGITPHHLIITISSSTETATTICWYDSPFPWALLYFFFEDSVISHGGGGRNLNCKSVMRSSNVTHNLRLFLHHKNFPGCISLSKYHLLKFRRFQWIPIIYLGTESVVPSYFTVLFSDDVAKSGPFKFWWDVSLTFILLCSLIIFWVVTCVVAFHWASSTSFSPSVVKVVCVDSLCTTLSIPVSSVNLLLIKGACARRVPLGAKWDLEYFVLGTISRNKRTKYNLTTLLEHKGILITAGHQVPGLSTKG